MKERRRNKRCIVCNKLTKRGGMHCSLTCWGITNKDKVEHNWRKYQEKRKNEKRICNNMQ